MESAQTTQALTESPGTMRRFFEAFPIFQFLFTVMVGLVVTWTTIQLTQNSQAGEIKRHGEKLEKLERESTPFILFDERTKTIIENQKETKDLIQKFLEKKSELNK